MSVTALAPWYGSARMIAEHVGKALDGCDHVAIPFAGGCCELLTINARTVVANDLHRHMMNLANVLAIPGGLEYLQHELQNTIFHPDELARSQEFCRDVEELLEAEKDSKHIDHYEWAYHYFNCCWMTRSGSAGTPSEFTGTLSIRWEAGGGDSNVRYRSAIESLEVFQSAIADSCGTNKPTSRHQNY